MTLSELLLGETIGDNVNLQTIIYHFSRSRVNCMLSKQISSISWFIVSKKTEHPMAKDVKFWFCADLLINFEHSSVIVSVVCNLAVLQILQLFRIRVISVVKKLSTEI